jgi:RimJ/RimL family protein N-acetyltransferase
MSEFKLKNNSILKISNAIQDDAEEILEYANKIGGESIYLGYTANNFPFTLEFFEKQINSAYESTRDILIIGKLDDKIVSTASIRSECSDLKSHIGNLGISVLKNYWNNGIASLMMKELINWVQINKEIKKLSLEVFSDNIRAINLYKKFNFEIEGTLKHNYQVENKFYDALIMGLLFNLTL